jgi:hypothetical protein
VKDVSHDQRYALDARQIRIVMNAVGDHLRTCVLDVNRSRNDDRLTGVNRVSHGCRVKDVSLTRSVMNAVGGHLRTCVLDVNRHHGQGVNLIQNDGRGLEVLVTSRGACRHHELDVHRESQQQSVMSAEGGHPRTCELDARREKKKCGVVCASSELSRSCAETLLSETCSLELSRCHPCGEQPWRVERLSLLLLERLFRRARLNCQI